MVPRRSEPAASIFSHPRFSRSKDVEVHEAPFDRVYFDSSAFGRGPAARCNVFQAHFDG